MFEIKVSKEIKDACPVFAGAAVYAAVKNTAYSEGLWQEINAFTEQLTSTTQMEDIKHQPVIFATREAYKRLSLIHIYRSLRLFQLFALYQRLMHERQSQSELVVSVHESSDKGVVYSLSLIHI